VHPPEEGNIAMDYGGLMAATTIEVVTALHGGTVRHRTQLDIRDVGTMRNLYRLVESAACQRLGRRVVPILSSRGIVLPADDTSVSTKLAGGDTVVECNLAAVRPRVLRVSPLWGPEGGMTLVDLHGEGFEQIGMNARVAFGSVAVPCERVSGSVLRCRTPCHAPGLVKVSLLRCEPNMASAASRNVVDDDDDDQASFQFVRFESAIDAIFSTTNSFCPVRSAMRDLGPRGIKHEREYKPGEGA
jgi:hypothetical protein